MSGITMCKCENKCELKDKCYRTTAGINEYHQSWSDFNIKECKDEDGKCKYFMEDR